MAESSGQRRKNIGIAIRTTAFLLLLSFSCLANPQSKSGKQAGVYFPPACLYGRSLDGIVHYMEAAGLNLAVLHAKDPLGRLFWKSHNTTAKNMGAPVLNPPLETAIRTLKQKGIWTAAKVDVFQDSLLVTNHPEMGVVDTETEELWKDNKGLHWANPYDIRVWEYTIALCLELIEIGIDEIQFDYIRFPSDGDLTRIEYPIVIDGISREECIGKFLAYANSRLKPAGAVISVDIFGMTAWKTKDFGVGQVLKQIAPHVDVVCPMFYPSHFPDNFLNLKSPGEYPYTIMKASLEEIKKRTHKKVRPWIQGFWYTPEEIDAQLRAVAECDIPTWTIWHPSGKYGPTFDALAARMETEFPEPEFYPRLEDLKESDDLVLPGRTKIINQTSYREGYSILSLDDPVDGKKNKYTTISGVASTLDESIIDQILTRRKFTLSFWTSRRTKIMYITNLLIQDLEIDPHRMSPIPIHIDWKGECFFSRSVPPDRLELYLSHNEEFQSVLQKMNR